MGISVRYSILLVCLTSYMEITMVTKPTPLRMPWQQPPCLAGLLPCPFARSDWKKKRGTIHFSQNSLCAPKSDSGTPWVQRPQTRDPWDGPSTGAKHHTASRLQSPDPGLQYYPKLHGHQLPHQREQTMQQVVEQMQVCQIYCKELGLNVALWPRGVRPILSASLTKGLCETGNVVQPSCQFSWELSSAELALTSFFYGTTCLSL